MNPFGHQGFDFFTTTPENKGIPALQAQHLLTFLRQPDQQGIDTFLLEGVFVPFLTGIDKFCIAPHKIQYGG